MIKQKIPFNLATQNNKTQEDDKNEKKSEEYDNYNNYCNCTVKFGYTFNSAEFGSFCRS